MVRRLVIIGCILLVFGVRYAWRKHERDQALLNQYAPAFNSLSSQQLVDSDWSYSGPSGKLTLRFEQDGKLSVISDGAQPPGHWELKDNMLSLYMPGASEPHLGIFSRSTDELSGPSPQGLEPHLWSASRIRDSR